MAKKNIKKTNNKKQSNVFENGDVTFMFDDETIQKEYLSALKKYENLNLNLPQVKVSRANAVSIIRGKDKKRLDKWLKRYDANDNDYKKGSLHKNGMYDKIVEETEKNFFRYQMDKLDKYWALIEKANDKWGKTTNAGETINRYNVVWYTNAGEGANSPV